MTAWDRNCTCCRFKNIRYPVAKIFSNGRMHVFLQCSRCNNVQGPVPKKTIVDWGYDLELLPVVEDLRYNATCERCQAPYAEYHHWMPVHILGREFAETWPKGWLCVDCHQEWHKLVTPDMIKKGRKRNENKTTN